jgi:hypothetical protein
VEVVQTAMAFGVEGKEKERGQGGDRGGRPQGINGQGGLDGNSGNATRGSFTTGAGQGNFRNHQSNGNSRRYGKFARGWHRQNPRGYRYSGTRFNVVLGHGSRSIGVNNTSAAVQHVNPSVTGRRVHAPRPVATNAVGDHAAQEEPMAPEVFRAQKQGKAKVEEGNMSESKEKPFCFRCYKPGHLTGKCPILKQPRLLAHPCGYEVSGLGFYHIPHAPFASGKSDNRTALVTVQGGTLSIPQFMAELSRLIPERWHWNVTQQDTNTFKVPFPSRRDLQRSVAFGKAEGVSLLFDEWRHEEEGLPLQRVWIRIFRLPQSLRDFSLLWALGSMLGATESVDMISSLRNDFGRVEVAVLNVDLLPNSIDTVVIGDRLFSLPIQIEGHEEEAANDTYMDLIDHWNGERSSGEKKEDSTRGHNSIKPTAKEQHPEGSNQQNNPSKHGKQTDDTSVVETDCEDDDDTSAIMNSMYPSSFSYPNRPAGNFYLNLSQHSNDRSNRFLHINELDPIGQKVDVPSQESQVAEHHKGTVRENEVLECLTPSPLKRSKRREMDADENSLDRATRLKAKNNLDDPGTTKSKSFLCFSDSRITSTMGKLGVLLDSVLDHQVQNIKNLELDRLNQASKNKQLLTPSDGDRTEDDLSDDESDFGLNQYAIKHLVGDIAEDIRGSDGSHLDDFKPSSRKSESGSNKKRKNKKKAGLKKELLNERSLLK